MEYFIDGKLVILYQNYHKTNKDSVNFADEMVTKQGLNFLILKMKIAQKTHLDDPIQLIGIFVKKQIEILLN